MTQEIDFNDPSLVEFFGKSIDLSGLEQAGDKPFVNTRFLRSCLVLFQ